MPWSLLSHLVLFLTVSLCLEMKPVTRIIPVREYFKETGNKNINFSPRFHTGNKVTTTPRLLVVQEELDETGGKEDTKCEEEEETKNQVEEKEIEDHREVESDPSETGGRGEGNLPTPYWSVAPEDPSKKDEGRKKKKKHGKKLLESMVKVNENVEKAEKLETIITDVEKLMGLFKEVVDTMHADCSELSQGEWVDTSGKSSNETSTPAGGEDDGWGPWTDWSPCSVTCGVGIRARSRKRLSSQIDADIQELQEKICRLPDCIPYNLFGYLSKMFNNNY